MTASTISTTDRTSPIRGATTQLQGLRPLFRKDVGEWLHGRRTWVIATVSTLFMVLAAANNALIVWLGANLGEGQDGPGIPTSLDPLDNLMVAAGFPTYVLAAIFVAMGLIVSERQSGTLAWIASKPASRPAIWLSKWASATVMLSIVAVVVPLAITAGIVAVLYGAPPVLPVVMISFGVGAAAAFFVAVVLAASTVVPSQAAGAAFGFAVYFLPSLLAVLAPFSIEPFLPTSITNWSIGLAMGVDVGWSTPIAWAASLVALAGFAAWRMETLEL